MRKFTKDFCINELKRIYSIHGKVTNALLKSEGEVSGDTIKRIFGSLQNAYEEAGIKKKQGQRKMVSKEEIVAEIQRLVDKHGYISKPIMEKHSSYSPKIVQRVFGSFTNMYNELGYEGHRSGRIPTNEELITECDRIYKQHDFLSYDLIEKFSNISTTCFKDRAKKMGWNGINYYREQVGCEIPVLDWGESPSAKFAIEKFTKVIGEEPEKEKKFEWLINKELKNPSQSPLRIDAYYPNANIAIEYNGPQHYFVDGLYTRTEEDLIKRKKLDKLKADLIKEHGIKLIVIHYKNKVDINYINSVLQ